MASNEKYTTQQVCDALRDSRGLVSVAAKRLGCSRATVQNYINRHATVKDAAQDARESLKDFAESKLFERIQKGDMTAIIFYLKTQAKDRGYIERQEVDLSKDIIVNVEWPKNLQGSD